MITLPEKKEMDGVPSEMRFKKGEEGEKYVASEIAKLGFKVLYVGGCQLYSITGEKFYSVDLEPFGNGITFWVQVKNKEPRKYYPDTGMELWRYRNLQKHEEESGCPVLVLFTENSRKIYGEWLKNLPQCLSSFGSSGNSKTGDWMIYFLLEKLKPLKIILDKAPM